MAEAGLISTLFPVMRAELGLAAGDLGVLIAASKFTAAAASPLLIWLVGRWNRKSVVVAMACLSGVATIAIGLAAEFRALMVLSCVLAVISGGIVPLITSIVADLFPDRQRGRAVGIMYASINMIGALLATLLSQLSDTSSGWRISYWLLDGLGLAAGLLNFIWFKDPGVGATTANSTSVTSGSAGMRLTARLRIFRIPTFNIMLLSRLLSGHLVIGSFGIVFLTSTTQFSLSTAGLVLLPFGIGSCAGNIGGALVADWMHARNPHIGRILFLQMAQFGFAIVAGLATQIGWQDIETYMMFWLFLGLLQGVNPGANRPVIMSVVRPELRPWAFVVMLSIAEPIGWAGYSLALSHFAEGAQLRAALLLALVLVMTLNGLVLTALYRTYRRDVAYAEGDGR